MRRALLGVVILLACKRAGEGGSATHNLAPDEGSIEPTLLVEAARPGNNDLRMVRFTPEGRWLLALDDTIGVWELDASAPSLREVGWFGLAADRTQPELGPLTPEHAFAMQDRIEEWKKSHEGIEDFELLPGELLVACGDAGTLSLWQLQLGSDPPAKKIAQQNGVGDGCYGVAASPDGRWVASFARPSDEQERRHPPAENDRDWQGAIQLWSVESRGALAPTALVMIEDMPSEGLFLPDGNHLLVVSSSQSLSTIALDGQGGATLLPEQRMDDTHEDIALVPGTRTVLFGGFSHQITRWDHDEHGALQFRRAYHHHQAKVRDVVPAHDGRFFVASSPDRTLSIWPLGHADDEIPAPVVLTASDDYVYGVDLHPGGPWLATAGNELRIWRINRGLLAAGKGATKSVVVQRWHASQPSPLFDVAWTSEDALVTTASDDGTRAWTIDGDALVAGASTPAVALPSTSDGVGVAEVAAVRDCLLLGRADGGLESWRKGAPPSFVARHDLGLASVSLLSFAPDGARALVAGRDAQNVGRLALVAFDATTCTLASSTKSAAIPNTPSGDVLSSSSYPGGGGAAPRAAAFSGDGRLLLTGDGDGGGALLWRVDPTGALAHAGALLGHHAGAGALAFAPDGRHAITAGNDGEVILHRLDAAAEPVAIERIEYLDPPAMPAFFSYAAAFSPSGRKVAVVGGWGPHGRVWVFEIDPTRR